MPQITINGVKTDFKPGQMILQVANDLKDAGKGVEIPQYCYHDGLSIVASCRICLAEVWAPNPKTGAIEPYMGGKLLPTCQTPAADGMVVYGDSPKAIANQKSVMEYLLINHPLDCPVCDQAGECFLQDYSYQYGRGISRFEETKVKQPKKDLGPHVYLYSDRCIMCTRCVRFTKEVAGTAELMVLGRGNKEEIDVFPGVPIANELSANVIDLCPVGALLDKDFLFAQRVWFLKSTPSIDPLTASGDNIFIEHNQGRVYRIKPRTNLSVNKWWITDEVRYGWKFVHSEDRLRSPLRQQFGQMVECDYTRAYEEAVSGIQSATEGGKRLAVLISPTLPCEEAYLIAKLARILDPQAFLALGPVPTHGQDKIFPAGARDGDPKSFKMYAEKAPNARGVRRVIAAFNNSSPDQVPSFDDFLRTLGHGTGSSNVGAAIVTGNYPSDWATDELTTSLGGKFVVLIDTLLSALVDRANVVLPGATFAEKAGCFENARNIIQAFEQAIPVAELAKTEGQLALDLMLTVDALKREKSSRVPELPQGKIQSLVLETTRGQVAAGVQVATPKAEAYNAANVRTEMARTFSPLQVFATSVSMPAAGVEMKADMQVVEL
jgi:NADH-quinone oxidoreductase subunit G